MGVRRESLTNGDGSPSSWGGRRLPGAVGARFHTGRLSGAGGPAHSVGTEGTPRKEKPLWSQVTNTVSQAVWPAHVSDTVTA